MSTTNAGVTAPSAPQIHLSQEEEAQIRQEIEEKIRKEVAQKAIESPLPPPPPPLFRVVTTGDGPRLLTQIRDFEGALKSIVCGLPITQPALLWSS